MSGRAGRGRLRLASAPARGPRDRAVAVLLLLASFGLYCTTTGNLTGYEPQTAAAAEGLVKLGAPRIVLGSPVPEGELDNGGRPYSHTGLAQPVLEAPFYWVGEQLDNATNSGRQYKWRDALLRFYNPAMATITVLAIFLLLRLRGRSQRQALAVAVLCALGSMIWPYSKIGMETTMMAMVALSLLGAAWATARGGPHRFALTGLAAGAAAASKPIGIVLLFGLLGFTGPVLALPRRDLIRCLVAFAVPLLAWIAAIAWYNAYRTGSITNFDQAFGADWFGAPIAALGMLISPGKGLLLYSPLVILGALGMRELWRADRPLALAIGITFLTNLVLIAGSVQWSEDTWGPRYVVATEWLLLLPVAWWATAGRRRRLLAGVGAVAILVQIAGVFAPYTVAVRFSRAFSKEPVFLYGGFPETAVAYGDEAPTWIPSVSELRLQLELLAAWLKERITGTGFRISYAPYWGRPGTADLTHTRAFAGSPLPDFWWDYPGQTTAVQALAVGLAGLGLGASLALLRIASPSSRRPGPPAPHPRTISSS